jgi:hypothetical protein
MPSTCRKPGCSDLTASGSAYCSEHEHRANVGYQRAPMVVQVKEARERDLIKARPSPLSAQSRSLSLAADERQAQFQQRGRRQIVGPAFTAQLATRKLDKELIQPMTKAFNLITNTSGWGTPGTKFDKYYGNVTGYNMSWFERKLRGPMFTRPIAVEVRDSLKQMSLQYGVRDKMYADRYCFELSLYCDAVIEKQDVKFIFSQASSVLKPIIGPAVDGVAEYAVKAGSKVAKKVIGSRLAQQPDNGYVSKNKRGKQLDPMRFTLAWMELLLNESWDQFQWRGDEDPGDKFEVIIEAFGGRRQLAALYTFLSSKNL